MTAGGGRLDIAGLVLESLAKTGGYEIFSYNLFSRLAARGHRVTVYAPPRVMAKDAAFYRALPFAARPLIPKTRSVLKRLPGLARLHVRLAQALRGHDLWQAMGLPEAWLALGAGRPVAVRCYGEDVSVNAAMGYGLRLDPAVDARCRQAAESVDAAVAMTESLARDLLAAGTPPERIHRIGNAIDAAAFASPLDREAVRAALGVDSGETLILSVGRNHRKKGFDLVPTMAARLKAAGLAFAWLVVGRETEALAPALAEAGVAGLVRTMRALGPVLEPVPGPTPARPRHTPPQIPSQALVDLYRAADVFVLPSRLEGFSRVLLEAQAAGLPCVTTDAPGCGEVVPHGRVLPVDDAPGMAAEVLALAQNPGLRLELGEKSKGYGMLHDWERIVDRYEELYAAMLR